MTEVVTVRMDTELYNELKQTSYDTRISMNRLCLEGLRQRLKTAKVNKAVEDYKFEQAESGANA